MSMDPEQIRDDIERTRATLSYDVDALSYEANPANMARRQVHRAKAAGSSFLDRVMGAADDAVSAVGDRASDVTSTVADAPHAVRRQAQGNPVAAGVVAFGLGLLVAAAFPPSSKEQELAQRVKEQAQPLTEQVAEAARTVGENLREPATQATESLKASAAEAVDTVRTEASDAGHEVQQKGQSAIRDTRKSA